MSIVTKLPGFRSGPNVDWGNLCSCMDTVITLLQGYRWCFRARDSSEAPELIEWSFVNRKPFGKCRAYDFLVSNPNSDESPPSWHDPSQEEVRFTRAQLLPRIPSNRGSPAWANSPYGSSTPGGALSPGSSATSDRSARFSRRESGKRSPIGNQKKGRSVIEGNDKPADVWAERRYDNQCQDHGPTDHHLDHDYIGYLHICCLNNMIPLRADIHALFDAHQIGIDTYDNNQVISFFSTCEDLTEHHLDVDNIPDKYRPLSTLLRDHLAQGVTLHCLPPTLPKHLSPHSGADSEEGGFEDVNATHLSDTLGGLSLRGGGKSGPQMDAFDNLRQYSAKGMEDGEGPTGNNGLGGIRLPSPEPCYRNVDAYDASGNPSLPRTGAQPEPVRAFDSEPTGIFGIVIREYYLYSTWVPTDWIGKKIVPGQIELIDHGGLPKLFTKPGRYPGFPAAQLVSQNQVAVISDPHHQIFMLKNSGFVAYGITGSYDALAIVDQNHLPNDQGPHHGCSSRPLSRVWTFRRTIARSCSPAITSSGTLLDCITHPNVTLRGPYTLGEILFEMPTKDIFTRDHVPVSLKPYLKWQLKEPLKLAMHGYETPYDALRDKIQSVFAQIVARVSLGGDSVEEMKSSSQFLDVLITRTVDNLHTAALEYGITLAHATRLAAKAEAEAIRIKARADADVEDESAQEMGRRRQEIVRISASGNKAVFVPTEAMGVVAPALTGLAAGVGADLRNRAIVVISAKFAFYSKVSANEVGASTPCLVRVKRTIVVTWGSISIGR
ncbi:hypothetical protein BJV78DRAFT_1352930 [Lactifluus subvellereus]|nr:hypothetical protein BJV78DRAFT_1352930 [Lactifluus subvellereus]